MKAQALADHLAENPIDEDYEPLKTYFLDEDVLSIDEVIIHADPGWNLFFNGIINMKGVRIDVHDDLIHSPYAELHTMSAPWPFVAWGMNMIGPIEPKTSKGHRFIFVAIDYFTKWIEATTFKSVIKKAVIAHRNSTPYHPKKNGAVEAANKNIKKILRKMIQGSRQWHEKLPFALLGYCTAVRTSTGATLYLLVYGIEMAIPTEVEIPSLQVIVEVEIEDD
ncbi:uncharacterized protein LOC124899529 [Capsicum annuum]|uniref:uncharacterized protein LOC124899529 n=1 Tax=Capsicum annuum TaxID=4072 RepID=UPI001FB0FE69|nr:uncharacterized protein LOC124899529 [Capsicum annuum]